MGASFERERATWKAQAARSLQSSKLTRSLGRSRSQSVGRARAQLKEVGGVGFLATKTLLGNQFAAPIIHTRTPSESTQTQQSHSRSGASHARTTSSSGLSRAGSRGKAALRAATGLCVSDDKMSPRDVHFEIVSRNDGRAKDALIEAIPRKPDAGPGPSPSPPVTSSSDVGLALCSPPPSLEDVDEPLRSTYAQVHPYAQNSQSPSRRSHARSSSDYAGPHPSAVSIAAPTAALASDMSARHRLPPHAALHPYASVLAYSSATSSQHPSTVLPAISSDSHQSARSLPVPPNRRPQLSDTRETPRGTRHAYALSNYLGGEPLAFVDALLSGPQRRLSADSGLGDSEQHSEAPASVVPLFSPLPDFVLTTPSEQQRLDPAHGSTFLSLNSAHTIGSSPPETLNPPVFTASMLSYSLHSAQPSLSDEPVQGSSGSSPHQSPQPFSSIEDLERYRNLFYRPRASGSSRTPSSEHHRMYSRDTGGDTSSNSRVSGGSGLTVLTRQLSSELEAIQDICRLDVTGGSHGNPPHMWGLRYGGLRGDDGMGSRTDPNAVLSIASESDMNSPGATMLPLSLHQNLGHQSLTIHIPQDVASQTSSVLDRSEMDDIDHDGTLKPISHRIKFQSTNHYALGNN
jgi:serine/arginine repetitive matrix protein 2